jgi:hypothetical protein
VKISVEAKQMKKALLKALKSIEKSGSKGEARETNI